MTAFTESD